MGAVGAENGCAARAAVGSVEGCAAIGAIIGADTGVIMVAVCSAPSCGFPDCQFLNLGCTLLSLSMNAQLNRRQNSLNDQPKPHFAFYNHF